MRRISVFDHLGQAVRFHVGGLLVRMGQDATEFVAADTSHHVRGADIFIQRLGDGGQCLVSGGVAEPVIDALHVVDVEENHTARRAVARGIGVGPFQLAHEGAAIGHRCQRIAVGQLFQVDDTGLAALDILAQQVDLTDEPAKSGLHAGRHLVIEDVEPRLFPAVAGFSGPVAYGLGNPIFWPGQTQLLAILSRPARWGQGVHVGVV